MRLWFLRGLNTIAASASYSLFFFSFSLFPSSKVLVGEAVGGRGFGALAGGAVTV